MPIVLIDIDTCVYVMTYIVFLSLYFLAVLQRQRMISLNKDTYTHTV